MRLFLSAMFSIFLLPRFSFAEDKPYELRFAPSFGYSSYSGIVETAEVALQLPVVGRWQWKVGGKLFVTPKYGESAYGLSTGPIYNFSDDRSRAYFIGAGVGWGGRSGYSLIGERKQSAFVYSEFGKRFKLNDLGTWSWSPNVKASSEMRGRVNVTLTPGSFSWSF